MWRTRIVELFRVLDDSRGLVSRIFDGNNLIILTMQDQRWNIKLPEILSEVGFGKRTLENAGGPPTGSSLVEPQSSPARDATPSLRVSAPQTQTTYYFKLP